MWCELACFAQVGRTGSKPTVILDDLARVKAVLLLIRTLLPEDNATQLLRPQIFDDKTAKLENDLHFK